MVALIRDIETCAVVSRMRGVKCVSIFPNSGIYVINRDEECTAIDMTSRFVEVIEEGADT